MFKSVAQLLKGYTPTTQQGQYIQAAPFSPDHPSHFSHAVNNPIPNQDMDRHIRMSDGGMAKQIVNPTGNGNYSVTHMRPRNNYSGNKMIKHGPKLEYTNTGQLWSYQHYNEGKLHGPSFLLGNEGNVQNASNHVNGQKVGVYDGATGMSSGNLEPPENIPTPYDFSPNTQKGLLMFTKFPELVKADPPKFEYNEDSDRNWKITPPHKLKQAFRDQPEGVKIEHHPYSEDARWEAGRNLKEQMRDQPSGTKRTYKTGAPSYSNKNLLPRFDTVKKDHSKARNKYLSKAIKAEEIGLIKAHTDDEDLADRIHEDKPDLEKQAAPMAVTAAPAGSPLRGGSAPAITAPMPSSNLGKAMFTSKYGDQVKNFSNVGRNCRSCGVLIKSIDTPCPVCSSARKGVRWHEGHLA